MPSHEVKLRVYSAYLQIGEDTTIGSARVFATPKTAESWGKREDWGKLAEGQKTKVLVSSSLIMTLSLEQLDALESPKGLSTENITRWGDHELSYLSEVSVQQFRQLLTQALPTVAR